MEENILEKLEELSKQKEPPFGDSFHFGGEQGMHIASQSADLAAQLLRTSEL